MAALHSSAALAVNVFDYWSDKPLHAIASALGIPPVPTRLQFEAQFPTGLRGTPPNLDIVLHYPDGKFVAVESKFTEWLTPKPDGPAAFKDKYFSGQPLWTKAGLPRAQSLAESVQAGKHEFHYLDAPQLLKHMLGVATCAPGRARLYYLYFDCEGPESALHRAEILSFSDAIGNDMPFHSLSYQLFFEALLPQLRDEHRAYADYLIARYRYAM